MNIVQNFRDNYIDFSYTLFTNFYPIYDTIQNELRQNIRKLNLIPNPIEEKEAYKFLERKMKLAKLLPNDN
jgi:hypothetical protein